MSSEIKIPDYPESVLISSRTGDLRTSSYIVLPKGEPLFSAYATMIAVDDEAGGAFIGSNDAFDAWHSTGSMQSRCLAQSAKVLESCEKAEC